MATEEPPTTPEPPPGRHLRDLFVGPRMTRGSVTAAVLLAALGFAAAVQVRQHSAGSELSSARQSDLVGVLDDVTAQSRRLDSELRQLQQTKQRLELGADNGSAALERVQDQLRTLGILAGTIPAQGRGIVLTITDPKRAVGADDLLNTVEELRDAGAEAIQINEVRVVANTYFLDDQSGAITVAGTPVSQPYVLKVIGDPQTLSTALSIPGGVLSTLRDADAQGRIDQRDLVRIDAVRPAPN